MTFSSRVSLYSVFGPSHLDRANELRRQGKSEDGDVVMYLLESAGVATVAGTAYGLSPYFRLSIATSIENLEEGCTRIARAVAELR